jgi:hypothetical protein
MARPWIWVDFPQATVDMLPRADAKWRFKSCAIVGNSGGLLGSKYGEAIDGHDAVWRINYAPSKSISVCVAINSIRRIPLSLIL